ncbi:MAG: hypothetical protein Q8R76_10695 [Candidatus Omnitrophota bacterium]|nr:hypothetical protein [Candidatus Omnitrophota bacterium]
MKTGEQRASLLPKLTAGLKKLPGPFQNRSFLLKLAILLVAGLVMTYALYVFLQTFIISSISNVHGGWDARYFWKLKAQFFVREPELWQKMFSPIIDWSHPDYPLMLPGSITWGWLWAEKEIYVWPVVIAFLFSLATPALVFWFLIERVSLLTAIMGATFVLGMDVYQFWAVSQYADIPLCFLFTAAGVVFVQALRFKEKSLFFLTGLLAGLSAWTKNEGIVFSLWIGLVFILILWRDKSFSNHPKKMWFLGAFLLGLAVPFACVIYIKTSLSASGDYLRSGRSFLDLVKQLFGDWRRTVVITASFFYYPRLEHWGGLWIFMLIAFGTRIFFRRHIKWRAYSWVFLALVTLVNLGYYLIIHITPHSLVFQLNTAMNRLLLHSTVLALLFIMETFVPDLSRLGIAKREPATAQAAS